MAASTQTATGDGLESAPSRINSLEAIKAWKETLTTKMDLLVIEINVIKQEFDKVRCRISEVEDRVSTVKMQVRALQEKAVDTEGRLRRNNVRIFGLPELVEGTKPVEFAEQLLITVLKLIDMSPTFVVE